MNDNYSNFIKDYFKTFFEEKDVEKVLTFYSENIKMYDKSLYQQIFIKDNIKQKITEIIKNIGKLYNLKLIDTEVQEITEDCANIFTKLKVEYKNNYADYYNIIYTVVKYENSFKIKTSYVSKSKPEIQKEFSNNKISDNNKNEYYNNDKIIYDLVKSKEDILQLQKIINNVPVGICLYRWEDNQLKSLVMNENFKKLIGNKKILSKYLSKQELLKYVHPDDIKRLINVSKKAFYQTHKFDIEFRVYNYDINDYKWIKMEGNIIDNADNLENNSKLLYIVYTDVTERYNMLETLKQKEASFDAVFANNHIFKCEFKIDENAVYFGEKIRKCFNLPSIIVNSRENWQKTGSINKEDIDKFYNFFENIRKGKNESEFIDIRMIDIRTKAEVWIRHIYTIIKRDENNNPILAFGTGVDITEQKFMEKQFNNERIFHEAFLRESICVLRYNVTQRKVMDYYGNSFGVNLESKYFFKEITKIIVDRQTRKEFIKKFNYKKFIRNYQNGKFYDKMQYRCRVDDGSIIWVETTVSLMRYENGDIIGLFHVKNINKPKIVEFISKSIMKDDCDFIAYRNKKTGDEDVIYALSEFGLEIKSQSDNSEKLRKSILNKIKEPDRENFSNLISNNTVFKEINEKGVYSFNYETFDKNNNKHTKKIRFYFLEGDKNIIVIVQRDITDIIAEEERKQKILERALKLEREADKLKSDFLSRMSHDLRTPLNGIIGSSTLALEEEVNDKFKDYLVDIKNSAKFMLGLVNDILDLNKIESNGIDFCPEVYTQSEFAREIKITFYPLCHRKRINFIIDIDDDNRPIMVDVIRLKQIIFNLLSNAVKFTEEGGSVKYSIKNKEFKNNKLYVTYTIEDTGCGMSEKFQKNMYKKFSQEINSFTSTNTGSGLGLAITKNLTELMGGTIECKSELNKGTTFTVTLPFDLADENSNKNNINNIINISDIQENIKDNPDDFLKGKRIILAEDHPINAKIGIRVLEKKGINVLYAENGLEALNTFKNSVENSIDAILMDIRMPIMDGIEATRQIRALNRNDAKTIPIIAMTANAFNDDKEACKIAGMNTHLSKPVEPENLFDTLLKLM